MKVSETSQQLYYGNGDDIQDLRHAIQKLLWLKTEELGGPSTYAPTISTILNRNYVEKGNLTVREKIYTISLAVG
jgi:DNA topoisomerase IA